MDEQRKPDPAETPNLKEFQAPTEETDPDLAQQAVPAPGEEHLKPVGDDGR